jgi:hypothetical protein
LFQGPPCRTFPASQTFPLSFQAWQVRHGGAYESLTAVIPAGVGQKTFVSGTANQETSRLGSGRKNGMAAASQWPINNKMTDGFRPY